MPPFRHRPLLAVGRAALPGLVCLAVQAMVPAPAAGQGPARVFGLVVDAGSGKPVSSAVVSIEEAALSVETTDRGRFAFPRLAAGRYTVSVQRIGYETRREQIEVVAGTSIDLAIRVSSKPIQLAPIEVVTRSGKLAEAGYYDRRDNGGISGHFITHAELLNRNATGLTDVLVNVPGVKVHYIEPGRTTVRFNRHVPEQAGFAFSNNNPIPGCEPDLYIDSRLYRNSSPPMQTGSRIGFGRRLNKVDDFNAVPVSQIDGVEVYVGAAVPPFVYNTACGVILIWTRR